MTESDKTRHFQKVVPAYYSSQATSQIEMSQPVKAPRADRTLLKVILQALIILAISAGLSQVILIPLFQDRVMSSLQRWEVEYLMRGTIDLLATEIERLPASDRAGHTDELSRQFGFAVSLHSLGQLDLNPVSLERLHRQEVVGDPESYSAYKMLMDGSQVLVFDQIKVPAGHLVTEGQRRHMGTLAMLERMLEGVPEDSWYSTITTAAELFDYPVKLTAASALDLTEDQGVALASGRIVTVETEDSATADYPAERVYKKIGNWVLALGPFSAPTLQRFYPAIAGYYAFLGLIVLLPLGLWLAPTWRSMNQLSRATSAFGQGEFSVRAVHVRGSKTNHLTIVFNQMAGKIQSLIESNKALVSAVSHELRTPISRIEFNIELARQSTDIDERNTHLDRIEGSVDELRAMVSEMLQFARFDREKPSFTMQSVVIEEWLHSELENWQTGDTEAEIQIIVPPAPARVSLERYYMSRAISNLVRNATRFAEATIRVTAKRAKGMFILSVEDDGPGVHYEERTRIFEPFVRHDQSRSRDTGGTGLGLAIVKQIAAWHSGEVWVEDSHLGGAKFVIQWPQTEGE